MHPYFAAELGRLRVAELQAEAERCRLVREARAARKAARAAAAQPGRRRHWLSWPRARRTAAQRPARVELVWPDGLHTVIELPALAETPRPQPRSARPGAGPAGGR